MILRVLWAFWGCSSLALFAAADAFQQFDPAFPLRVVIWLACGAQVASSLTAVLIGRGEKTGYGLFMPFQGGTQFVAMQAIAYAAGTCALVGPAVYLHAARPYLGVTHGVLSVCGALSATSNFMLVRSVQFFDPSKKLKQRRAVWTGVGEVLLVLVLCLVLGIVAAAAEYIDGLEHICAAIVVVLHFSLGGLNHVVIGWMRTPNFRLFAPLQGSTRQRFVRATAWIFWTAIAVLGVGLAHQPRLFPRCHVFFAALAITSNLGLLAHTRTAPRSDVRTISYVARDGRFVLSLLSILCALTVGLLTVYRTAEYAEAMSAIMITVTLALFLVPPLTQLTGRMLHGDQYDLWRPFQNHGGMYLTLQALGWMCFTMAFVAAAFEWPRGESLVAATALLLSQMAIHSSVRCFVPPSSAGDDTPSSSPLGGSPVRRRKAGSPKLSTTARKATLDDDRFFQTDFLGSVAVALVSLALRFSCDLVGPTTPDFPLPFVVLVSSALWAVSVPLCHAVKKDAGTMFTFFRGSPEYVAFQTIGWIAYAVCAVLALVVSVELFTNEDVGRRRSGTHRFLYTMQGLVMQVPFALIAASLRFFDETDCSSRRAALTELTRDLAPEDFEALSRMVSRAEVPPRARALLTEIVALKGHVPAAVHDTLRGTATIVTLTATLLCIAFSYAADYSKSVSSRQAIAFQLISAAISAVSCIAVHAGFAPFVHGDVYKRWMPFRGGSSFVAWQACAGATFAVGVILSVIAALSLLSVPVGSPALVTGIITAGVCFGAAPLFTLISVYYFDAQSAALAETKPTLFESHAEGIVSLLVLCATWLFSSAYAFMEDPAEQSENWALIVAPLLLGSMSFMVALPLGVISVRNSAKAWSGELQDSENLDNASFASRSRSATPLVVLDVLRVALSFAIPALGLLAGHFLYHRFHAPLFVLARGSSVLLGLLVVFSAIGITARVKLDALPTAVIDVIAALQTFSIYNIIFSEVLLFYVPLTWSRSLGSVCFACNVVACMCPTPIRNLVRFATLAFIGLLLYRLLVGPYVDNSLSDLCFATVCAAYHATYGSGAEEDGSRYSLRTVKWFRANFFWGLERYFTLRIINDDPAQRPGGTPEEGGRQVVYGYHPHGMFPITTAWMQATEQWEHAVGSAHRSVVHAASILFNIPIVRDVCMSLGGRVVTRRAIEHSLTHGISPMIVPGGQAEMLHTSFSMKRIGVVTHHKGFIRLAIQHSVALVPVFAFGEHNIMDNVHIPRVQRYFLDRFGVGFPVLPWGRWYLPLPVRTPLTIVVGRIVDPAVVCPDKSTMALEEVVDKVAEAYFAELKRVVARHRVSAGYPGFEVDLIHPKKKAHTRSSS